MELKRVLGLPSLTFYGVGIILGAGIYSVLGVAAAHAGDALWLSFALGSVVALLTAFSYAELTTTYPQASAEFNYLRRALPRWPSVALVTGLLVALSGAATAATVSVAFAGYLQTFVQAPLLLVALGLLGVVTALNIVGVKESGWINALFTLIEAGGLIMFVIVGADSERFAAAFKAAPTAGLFNSIALVFFSFLGFENIANLSEEAEKPERDLPRAIFLSLGLSSVLYVLVALAAVSLMPGKELGEASAPLVDAARIRSPRLAGALGGIALFATANTALVSMLVASRVLFGIARERELPAWMARLSSRRKTPWAATLVIAAVAVCLLPFGDVGAIASLSSFAALLAFALVNVSLIVLRYREPKKKRPFRVPLHIKGFPILPALGVVTTLAVATQLNTTALISGISATILFLVYSIWRHR